MKKSIHLPMLGFSTILAMILGSEIKIQSMGDNPSLFTFTTLDKTKILDMDFNNNTITNNVTNKSYNTANGTGKLVSSIKGNGFEFNNDYIVIPKSDLNIKDTDNVMTVSFTYTFDGTDPDTNGYVISFGNYNLHLGNNAIGFNTLNNDIYGISHNFKKGETYHIIAEFNKNNVANNKIYIDGVKQNLAKLYPGDYDNTLALFNEDFTIGNITNTTTPTYSINEPSVIDEIKIYKKSLTQSEVNNVVNAHKIPELRGEIVNNSYPKMSWATEILPENVLYKFGFEGDEQDKIDLVYDSANNLGTGGQEYVNSDKYTGLYSLKTPVTIPGKGNGMLTPYVTPSNYNQIRYSGLKLGFDQGIPISATYRAKTNTSGGTIRLYGNWTYDTVFSYYNSYTLEDYPAGTQYIKVSNPQIFPLAEKSYVHVTLDSDPFVQEQNLTGYIVDMENGIFRLSNPLKRDVPKGTQLRQRKMVDMFSFPTQTIVGNNNWNLYNANAYIAKTVGIDWHLNPQILRQSWSANSDMYIDDIIVGHATKVRLYRDGNKVYEGYESELNDTTAKDKAIPTSVSDINSTMEMINITNSTRRINISFNKARDVGTEYDYQISALSKEGIETPKSNVLKQTVTSGIKGYSYVIDKNPTTNPDNTVDTTSNKISKDITDSGVYYLHIKTIDNAGNVSGTTHYKIDVPILTAKANPSQNMIRLDWTLNDKSNKIYKVYQRKEGSNDFQSISTTDLSSTKKIKVLNIYPDSRYDVPFKEISFTDWKGNSYTLPESASLKQWMEEPKEGYPKGYGMGIIDIDIVAQSEFNLDPNSYLKNADGSWKYEVIANGFGDGNGGFDYTDESIELVRSFIKDGRGYLVGHDTIIGGVNRNTNNLRDLFNIKLSGDENVGSISHLKGNQVSITKKGLLLNYPHEIGDIGTILDVPSSHSTAQLAYGDIWMNYKNPIGAIATDSNGNGTNNFYLTSFNNTAMIQTGHYVRGFNEDPTPNDTIMEATVDEQKILANTLFYLNQLSTDNYLDDNSGQDVKAPNKPVIYGHNFTGRGKVEVNFREVTDNGSNYEYYVQSEYKNGQITLSNTDKETITSGIKGYSYVVDSKANTIPDTDIEISKAESIKVNINDNTEKYVHIRAIDNVGNASETYHYKITESTKPTMSITGNPTEWTGKNVTLNVTADDLDSGMDYIVLPNGNRVAGQTASYTVTTNGSYVFKAVDRMGNETTQTVVVDKIDNENPQISYRKELSNDKTSMNLVISGYDSQSGIDYFIDPDGNKRTEGFTYKVINNGIYPFSIYDKVGRVTSIYIEITELNTNINPSDVARIEYKLSGATIKDWTTYDKPFYITNEGITTITARAYDRAGNLSNESTSQVKIDKTKPNNNSILIELK